MLSLYLVVINIKKESKGKADIVSYSFMRPRKLWVHSQQVTGGRNQQRGRQAHVQSKSGWHLLVSLAWQTMDIAQGVDSMRSTQNLGKFLVKISKECPLSYSLWYSCSLLLHHPHLLCAHLFSLHSHVALSSQPHGPCPCGPHMKWTIVGTTS